MDKTILEQLKAYFLELDKKRKFNRLQDSLKYAIKSLDAETVKQLLESGASIELIEQEESTLGIAADEYYSKLYEVLNQHRKENHKQIDLGTYHWQIIEQGKDELELELNTKMAEITKKLLAVSEVLYQYGANINHNTYLGYKDQGMLMDIISEKREIVKIASVFERMCAGVIGFSKDIEVLEWIANKPDFDITKLEDSNVVTNFLYMNCPESIQGLQLVSEKGLRLKESEVYGIKFNALIDCLIHQDIDYRQEKFNILWKMATESQKNNLVENFNTDTIELPGEARKTETDSVTESPKNR